MPKAVLLLDRDGLLNEASDDPASPLYYITKESHLRSLVSPESLQKLPKDIPVILATKQRAVGKGLLSPGKLNKINSRLQKLIKFTSSDILVETKNENKARLFKRISKKFRNCPIFLVDNSKEECRVAQSFGIHTLHTGQFSDIFKWEKFWSSVT